MHGQADTDGVTEGAGALAVQVREHSAQLAPELAAQFVPVQPDLTRKEASTYLMRRWQLSYEPGSLARLGTAGRGPAYHMRGRFAYYAQADLDTWAQTKITAPRRRTPTSEARAT
jgi:hypothetical protein